jgi:hypothetical protein
MIDCDETTTTTTTNEKPYLHGGISPRIENLARLDAFDRGIETRAHAASAPRGGGEGGGLSFCLFVCLFFVGG